MSRIDRYRYDQDGRGRVGDDAGKGGREQEDGSENDKGPPSANGRNDPAGDEFGRPCVVHRFT